MHLQIKLQRYLIDFNQILKAVMDLFLKVAIIIIM